jgi:hypothetical protein
MTFVKIPGQMSFGLEVSVAKDSWEHNLFTTVFILGAESMSPIYFKVLLLSFSWSRSYLFFPVLTNPHKYSDPFTSETVTFSEPYVLFPIPIPFHPSVLLSLEKKTIFGEKYIV